MDVLKSDLNAIDLESEIAETIKLIKKLDNAKQSIDQQRNINLEACYDISRELKENKDNLLRSWIDRLRVHIVCLEQFPIEPPYYYPRVNTTSSLHAKKTEVMQAEEAMRKLNFQFQHNNKNMATERKIGRELRVCQSKLHKQRDHHAEDRMQETLTNRYYNKYRCYKYDEGEFSYVLVKPSNLPTENTKELIKMWVEKIQDASNRILEDSKTSIPTGKTRDKLRKLDKFGMQFYWHVGVGRKEFESLWDSMKDTKKNIEEIKSSLIKVRNRHQKGCLRMERVKEKRIELEKSNSELWGQLRIIRQQKFVLEQKLKQMNQLQVNR